MRQLLFSTPLARALAIVRALDPVRLAQVFLDFVSVVRSQFWDGRRTGPDFIAPMASLTKRQSGHLAKLALQHGKNLPKFETDRMATILYQSDDPRAVSEDRSSHIDAESNMSAECQAVYPHAVAVLEFDDVLHRHHESQYTTPADVDLMVLVPILLSLLVILGTCQWSPASEFIAIEFIAALILGPGTLTLIRRTAVHPTELDPGPGCAVLMDDDFTVVIRGSQRIVEAITEGGFYLSFTDPRPTARRVIPVMERWQEKQVISDVLYGALEGGCRGICEAIVMRFLHLYTAIPNLKETAYVVVFGRMMVQACWWGLKGSTNDSLPPAFGITPLRSVARLTGEFLGLLIVAACIASASSATILLHGVSFFIQSFYFGLFARLVLQSQNYRIRTERFLDALGYPLIRKWPFDTRASAATFACLVLCRDIPRPVRSINVLGVLDILIPNQREVWRAWKERVADRIIHEECITFAPTIPTFPDQRQERLKRLLDEAQSAYDKFHLPHHNASDV